MTNCYVHQEHKMWVKRDKKELTDEYFYTVLQDSATINTSKIKLNYPYVFIDNTGYFHSYYFDKDQNVYSKPWINEDPEYLEIINEQSKIGYYTIKEDSLIIETIANASLFGIPWKYAHTKKVAIISGDTINIPKKSIDIKDKNTSELPTLPYTPLNITNEE